MPGAEESLSTTLASIQEGVERANEAWASWRATAVNASLAALWDPPDLLAQPTFPLKF